MSTKGKALFLIGVAVTVFLLMIIVMTVGINDMIERQNKNNRNANCTGEFETVECFDKRIKNLQLRKELNLMSKEDHGK